jgi:hypothetical protein
LFVFEAVIKRLARFLYSLTKPFNMRSILYLIAVICVIGWVFGFFFSGGTGSTNNLIHILLVLAVIAILISVIRRA